LPLISPVGSLCIVVISLAGLVGQVVAEGPLPTALLSFCCVLRLNHYLYGFISCAMGSLKTVSCKPLFRRTLFFLMNYM